jgi:hypothetical protein
MTLCGGSKCWNFDFNFNAGDEPHTHANRPAVNRRAKKQRPVNGAEHDNTNQSRF